MKMRKIAAAAMAGALAVSLAACGSTARTGPPPTGEAARSTHPTYPGETGFTVQLGPNPETLDPALNASIDGGNTLLTIEEPLLIIDENNELEPGKAESYTVSEDGLTYTFHLREGLKWSDGTPLTAHDFVYSWQRAVDPATGADYAYMFDCIAGYTEAINGEEYVAPAADASSASTSESAAESVSASTSESASTSAAA